MAIVSGITPQVMRLLTSPALQRLQRARAEWRRVRSGQPHRVTVYLRINDPYSYLLLQVLEQLASRYPLTYDFRTVSSLQRDMYPAPGLWERNAFRDGAYLAALYDIRFPRQRPQSSPERDARLTAQLLHWELAPGYLARALQLFQAYWEEDGAAAELLVDARIAGHVECYRHHLQANENLLQAKGHYLSAMLHYGGEWYWGLDRLEHLERRFNAMGAGDGDVLFDRGYRNFCRRSGADRIHAAGSNKTVELFWSLRSPYSFLGLLRARQLAVHYRVPLVVKPVLPMVMRRMQVPRAKSLYITLDAKREALKYGIEFGLIADPLGKGVERCYALYAFAQAAGKGLEFLESCARGAWAEGIRSDTDAGLEVLVERAGLNWGQARGLLGDDSWRVWAQENLAQMYGHDFWGVPSFTYGEVRVFGQDRLDCIERAIVGDLAAAGS